MMKPRIYALMLALMMISDIPAAARAKEEVTVPMLQFTKKALPDLESYRFAEGLGASCNRANTFDANDAGLVLYDLDY